MFYTVDHVDKIGDPETVRKTDGCDGWIDKLAYKGDCTITSKIRFKAVLDLYMCTAQDMDPQRYMCPSGATVYLGEYPTKELSTEVTHTITIAEYQKDIDPIDILFGSWIQCVKKVTPGVSGGSWTGCAWAAVDVASLFAGKILRPIADAIKAVDAAARTGIGFTEAFQALRALGLAEDVVLSIGTKGLDGFIKTCTKAARTPLVSRAAMAAEGCPVGLIAYDSGDLSKWAFKFRTRSGYYEGDHNVAVALVTDLNDPKTGNFLIANSNFQGHAETELLDDLVTKKIPFSRITALYTERQPCPACAAELSERLKNFNIPITWSVPYHPSYASSSRQMLDRLVRETRAKYGMRSTTAHQPEEQEAHD
jgi:hypothetical protein